MDNYKINKISELIKNNSYVGRGIIIGKSKNNKHMLSGRTDSNKVVIFEGKDDLIGKVVPLEIVSEHMWYLKGEIKHGRIFTNDAKLY